MWSEGNRLPAHLCARHHHPTCLRPALSLWHHPLPCRYSLKRQDTEQPLGAAAALFTTNAASAQQASPSSLRPRSVPGSALGPGSAAGTPSSAAGAGGKYGDAQAWQPFGMWQAQKERLVATRGQAAHAGSGIPATWDPSELHAQQQQQQQAEASADTVEAAAAAEAAVGSAAPAGSPFTQGSSAGLQQRPPPSLRAGTLAAAAAAAAGSASPMAKSVRAASSLPQSPVRYHPESLRLRSQQQQQAPAPASPGPAPGAEVFAVAAAADAASPMRAPAPEPPSPMQLSPESQRLRQLIVRAPPPELVEAAAEAAQRLQAAAPPDAATVADPGAQPTSPGSLRHRQAAAAQAQAVAQLELRRLQSEQQGALQEAAAEAASAQEAPLAQLGGTPTSRYAMPQAAPQQEPVLQAGGSPATVVGSAGPRYAQAGLSAEPAAAWQGSAALVSAHLAEAQQVGGIAMWGAVGTSDLIRVLGCSSSSRR